MVAFPAQTQPTVAALAECARIDDAREWPDKAAALASYAKEADETSLHDYATRTRGRAVHRGGQILAEMRTPNDGSRNGMGQVSGPTLDTKRAAALAAGLSKRQEVTYARIAAIPADVFEALIESEHPPTVSRLAEVGKKWNPLQSAPPGFAEAT